VAESAKSVTLYRLAGSKGTWRILVNQKFPIPQVIVECVETGIERHCRMYDLIEIEEN
jgi:hypothetical protein